jgi:hypothetical protein
LAILFGEPTIELDTPFLEPQLRDLAIGTAGYVPMTYLVLIFVLVKQTCRIGRPKAIQDIDQLTVTW